MLLEIEEAQVQSFRALSASMCLALTLVVAPGQRLDESFRPNEALAGTES